jgi:hypothetical protein
MHNATAIRKILVIADEAAGDDGLRETLLAHAERTEVILVAPARDDADDDRLTDRLHALDVAGVHIAGWVGPADPLAAIADALSIFDADEVLVVTHPAGRSAWLADDLIARACARFGRPVAHLVAQPRRLASSAAIRASCSSSARLAVRGSQ